VSHKLSCLGCPEARILLISASPNTSLCRITGVSHQHLASSLFLRQVSIPLPRLASNHNHPTSIALVVALQVFVCLFFGSTGGWSQGLAWLGRCSTTLTTTIIFTLVRILFAFFLVVPRMNLIRTLKVVRQMLYHLSQASDLL
jgi:hypothetical protein